MKTATATIEVTRSGVTSENAFRIKATGKAFRILSDGLYTDKIGAVIRELACNAYDAHVAAGHPSKPFDVRLPNSLEPSFAIRDYGTGLSHPDVMALYTTYFESTKTDSNDFVGALGLGSKSPFSYVDQFTVRSWHGGHRRTYTAFIGEHGIPAIALMEDIASVEPIGLEVSFPVKVGDALAFRDRAAKFLKWFDPVPSITGVAGFKVEADEKVLSGAGWYVRKAERSYSGHTAYALQGRVAYPLRRADLPNLSADLAWLLDCPIVVTFNIGDLEVAASREALSLDPRTVANITARLVTIRAHVEKEITKSLATATTYYEACRLWHTLADGADALLQAFRRLNSFKPKWRGQPIRDGWEIETHSVLQQSAVSTLSAGWRMETADRRALKRRKATLHGTSRAYLSVNDRFKVFIGDVDKYKMVRLQTFAQSAWNVESYLILTPPEGADLADLEPVLRGCPYQLLSTLPEPAKGAAAGRTKTAKLYRYNAGDYRKAKTWPTATVDYTAGGVYVPVENLEASGLPMGLDTLLAEARNRGLTGELYGVPRTHRKTFENNSSGWVHLVDWLKERVEKELTPAYLQSIADNQAWNTLPDDFIRIHGRMRIKTPDLKSPAFEALTLRAPRGVNTDRFLLAHQIGVDTKLPPPSFDYTAIVATFLARYPLLSHIGLDNIKQAGDLGADYIKTVDTAHPV
jgi:hypothetical protein